MQVVGNLKWGIDRSINTVASNLDPRLTPTNNKSAEYFVVSYIVQPTHVNPTTSDSGASGQQMETEEKKAGRVKHCADVLGGVARDFYKACIAGFEINVRNLTKAPTQVDIPREATARLHDGHMCGPSATPRQI